MRQKVRQTVGLFNLFGRQSDEAIAEAYIRSECEDENHISALVRHYHVSETTGIIEQLTGARLTDQQTTRIVQKLRDEYGMGPIDEGNLPGSVDPDDTPEDQEYTRALNAQRQARDAEIEAEQQERGGLLGWLFGR